MADAATFDIAINAQSIGVDASAAELARFADRIYRANDVAAQFDGVIAAARKRLDETASAAKAAADTLGIAETRYKELESAANKAAKAVEKAALAGKDTSDLTSAAASASAAMQAQANVVDDLRAKSNAAAASQAKLTSSLATLQAQSKKQVAANQALVASDKSIRMGNYAAAAKANERRLDNAAIKTAKWTDRLGTLRTASLAAGAAFAVAAVGLAAFAVAQNPAEMALLHDSAEKLKKDFGALFKGLKLAPFVDGLRDIMRMFHEGTSSAKGMKLLVETLLQPIFDAGAKLAPFIKEMFKGMVYGLLSVAVEVLRLRNNILKMIPQETRDAIKAFVAEHFTMEAAFKAGAALVVIATVALGAFAVAAIAAAWPILLVVAAIALVVAAFVYWEEILASISEAWWALDKTLRDAVKNIISGIVNGIKNGAGAVYDAMANMASGAITAFKNKLGIKSPSAVFAMQANYTTQGYVEGIEDGQKDVDKALETMVDADIAAPMVKGGKGASGTGGAASTTGNVFHVQTLNVGNSPVAQENWNTLRRIIGEVLEGAVITIGGGEAPAT